MVSPDGKQEPGEDLGCRGLGDRCLLGALRSNQREHGMWQNIDRWYSTATSDNKE